MSMGSDSKCNLTPPTIWLGFSFVIASGISFFGGIKHSPVNSCSALSCDFGVFSGEDECMSFYPTISESSGIIPFRSLQFSHSVMSDSLRPHELQHARSPCPIPHQFPEFTQTYVHRVGDAIQPSHPLSSPSPPAHNPSQHQSLFQ